MRILRAASQPVVPWKNGGGTTRPIVTAPSGASLDTFDWRVSRAHVAADGPFSIFAGVDRTLLVLAGEGVRLAIAGRGAVTLTPESAPLLFSGDVAVIATLLGGPIDDLNVMSRRGRARHTVVRRRVTGASAIATQADATVVVVDSGELVIGETTLSTADAVLCGRSERITVAAPEGASIVVVEVQVQQPLI